uniref:Uncharacterized protein n=1 Tax=Knipowitschia caucasica TaxID=637954 RepID=A0AAV2KK31_KNICA
MQVRGRPEPAVNPRVPAVSGGWILKNMSACQWCGGVGRLLINKKIHADKQDRSFLTPALTSEHSSSEDRRVIYNRGTETDDGVGLTA